MLEENERAYSLDTTLAHCMGKQVTYKESPSCICHGNMSAGGKKDPAYLTYRDSTREQTDRGSL